MFLTSVISNIYLFFIKLMYDLNLYGFCQLGWIRELDTLVLTGESL